MLEERIIQEVTDLMQIVYRINRSFSHSCLDDRILSLPPAQLHALFSIQKQQPLNMTQLAEYMLVTRQQLTKIIDSLVEKGLVERGADPENRRHVILRLSDEGLLYVRQLMYDQPNFLSQLLGALNDTEAHRFLEAISIMKDVLSKAISKPE